MHYDTLSTKDARTLRVPSTPLALALMLALGSAPLASHAATIAVTSTADTSPSSACTLRDAIESMNAAALVGGCANTGDAFGSNDTILFDAGVFPTDGSGTITLSGSRLALAATDIVIDATANANVTIDANHASGVMIDTAPAGSTLELRHLTLTNGNVITDDCKDYAQGGGICVTDADLTLVHSTLSGNLAVYGGGILSYGKITLKHSTLSGNSSVDGGGGGILGYADIVLENSTVSGNVASYGGGGIIANGGNVTLTNSTLSGNSASTLGGGIYNFFGSVSLINSTLTSNSAGEGGGIFSNGGNVTLTNSTLSGNLASGHGGGIYVVEGNVTLTNSTLSGNSAVESGGGIVAYSGTSVEAINSIVAGNTQSDSDIAGVTPTGSGNLIGVVSNLNLGPLADNGGTTWTMLPLAGSAAIDAVACTEAPTTDQRGVSRPQGAQCDIGAVEVDLGVIFADGFEGVGAPL